MFEYFTSMCFQKKQANFKPRRPKAHQLQAGAVYAKGSASYDHLDEESTSEDSFCLQVKIKCSQDKEQKVPRPTHLITNLAYRLNPHHTRNRYLKARLDTCADLNLMPASMYQLVFNDAKMQKLALSELQVGIYTTDTVMIVGSCTIYRVHPDPKKLIEMTFYVAMNNGGALLSCKTTLLLGLIQPRPRLDYLPPRASLITSSADHPKKTKAVLHTQKQKVSAQTTKQEVSAQTTKQEVSAQTTKQEVSAQTTKQEVSAQTTKQEVSAQTTKQEVSAQTPAAKRQVPKLITSKEMILCEYPDVFEEIGKFPGPDYHIQVDPSVPPKQTPC